MDAEIIAIGTELLLGQSVDTNSSWLARNLARLGFNVFRLGAVGDNERRLAEAIQLALSRSEVVLTTGGLGPTVDDVTRKAVARALQKPLVFHEELAKALEARFKARGLEYAPSNLTQAFLPQGATLVPNPGGTAPGFWCKSGKGHLACLPGVPSEMKSMFEATVEPALRALDPRGTVILSRVYRTTGLAESLLNEKILDLFEGSENPTVAVLAHAEGVDIRLTARADGSEAAVALLDALGKRMTERLPQHIYGWDQDVMETIVGRLLATRNLTLACAESLTGGLVAQRLTQVPGATRYFRRGYVTYSDESKSQLLQVPDSVLRSKGAVSPETALAMARGCRQADGADLGVSTTGIAGPAGGTPEKPVGLVYVGLADEANAWVREFRFSGTRDSIQRKTAQAALEWVRRYCLQLPME